MQTNFTEGQLADSGTRIAEKILRACVHCGFCTSTCPTYALLGDELDSPRGRIYLIKDISRTAGPRRKRSSSTSIAACPVCPACRPVHLASIICIWSIMPGITSKKPTAGHGSTEC